MSKKYAFIYTIYFLLLSTTLCAQNELNGKISDAKTNEPLRGVSVYIPDLKTGTASGADGSYHIKNIPSGSYIVEVSIIGYASQLEKISVKGTVKKDYLLNASTSELKDVVVTGVLSATDNQKNPIPIAVMTNKDLLQNSSTNIIDAITRIPGVSAITDGQSIAKPVIRGLGYNRVVTVADGVPQQGQQWGDEFGIEVDQNAVSRVEILKGPASLAYGSDAISGVINLIAEQTLPEGQIKGDVLLNYQTNNGLINNAAHIAGNNNGISWSARIDNTMAHAYQNKNDGYVLNSQFSNFNFDGTIGIHKSWGFSKLHYSYFDLRTGIVDGTRDSATGILQRQSLDDNGDPIFITPTNQELKSYTPLVINQAIHHQKLVWDNSIAVGDGRITGTFAWQQNRRQENNDPTMPNVSNIYYYLNSVNYDLRYISPNWNDFNLSIGVNGIYQNSKNKGTLLLIPEYNLFNIGAFAIATKKIGNLNISGGIRYDTRKFKGHDDYIDADGNQLPPNDPNAIHQFVAYNSDFNGVSASLGAAYQITPSFYVKANVARGFRAANVAETGSNGIHDGTVVYEIGDPNLKPETNVEFDLSPGFSNADVNAEINFFSNTISNYIYPNALKSVNGGDSVNNTTPGFGDAPVFKYTQGKAQLIGGEFVLDIHPQSVKWLDWYTAFSTVNAYLKNQPDSTKYPPFIPPSKLQSELTINFGKACKSFSNTYFTFGVVHSFEQKHIYNATAIYDALSDYELAASLAPTKSYTLINLGAGTDVIGNNGNKLFSLYISINNLFNTAYMDYMSRFKYYPANLATNPVRVGVYNMGRNISFKLLIPIDIKN
ncbi:MAG TPA: TonB-dependent receptor [Puia sp.]|nr:TonB-dependent receptor [Puia sp.]